jgi:hypothetical protein
MTRRDQLFRKLQGNIYHVTWIGGLRGILDSGEIRPNPDGSLGHSSLGSVPDCYVCQKLSAVSLLDLRHHRISELFDKSSFKNWVGVFTYNEPCIALQLDVAAIKASFIQLSREEVIAIPGRFIVEAEICHRGAIPISAVFRAHIIRGVTWDGAYDDLETAYLRSVAVRDEMLEAQKQSVAKNGSTMNPSHSALISNKSYKDQSFSVVD